MKDANCAAGVVRVAVPVPLPGEFDYLPPAVGKPPMPGQRVLVPFGRRQLVGVVTRVDASSDLEKERLQPVGAVLDDDLPTLPPELLGLLRWCADYYKHPLGEVIANALPPPLRRADGRLPEAPRQWRLTEKGRQQLEEGPGRARARHRVLEALVPGPLTPPALRETPVSRLSRRRALL